MSIISKYLSVSSFSHYDEIFFSSPHLHLEQEILREFAGPFKAEDFYFFWPIERLLRFHKTYFCDHFFNDHSKLVLKGLNGNKIEVKWLRMRWCWCIKISRNKTRPRARVRVESAFVFGRVIKGNKTGLTSVVKLFQDPFQIRFMIAVRCARSQLVHKSKRSTGEGCAKSWSSLV